MILTITGDLGSGKSTVAKLVSKELKLNYYSTGQMFRKLAVDMQVSFKELNDLAKKDKRIDKRIDDYQKKLGKTENDFILEGRLGFHFIPKSIKICLRVEPKEAARRIMTDNRSDEKFKTLKEAEESIKSRARIEKQRYEALYKINIDDDKNYDLIIDTTKIPATEVAKKIIKYAKET
ncbi:MAG: cytidylate kinase family protein [Candidatus Nanoarchaeia archaeon]|jgi:cytidylate kinase